jgi:YesN/AraC family two-component response regulator
MSDSSKLETLSLDDLEFTLLVDSTSEILVVDDEDVMQVVFKNLFEEGKCHLEFASSGEQALEMLKEREYNLVIVDKNLPGMSGIELIPEARKIRPYSEFIIVTGYASYQSVVEALRLGAFDYLEKPFQDIELVKEKVIQALDKQRLSYENVILSEQLREVHQELQKTINELAQKDQPGGSNLSAPDSLKVEHQLDELKAAATVAVKSIDQALRKFITLVESRTIQRDALVSVRGLLEKAWMRLVACLPELRQPKG